MQRFLLAVAFLMSLGVVVPCVAQAAWRLEVKDLTTSQIWTFEPPSGKSFVIPFGMSGWGCTVGELEGGKSKFRTLLCLRDDSTVESRVFPKIPAPVVFLLSTSRQDSHVWRVALSYQ